MSPSSVRFVVLACLLLAAGSRPAAAQSCSPPIAQSLSSVCGPISAGNESCSDSGTQTGSPAVSSRSDAYALPEAWNLGGEAAMTMDVGAFDAFAYGAGSTNVYPSFGVRVRSSAQGTFDDCLTLGGGEGPALLHVPIHLTGARTVEWSLGGGYQSPSPPASVTITILCAAMAVGGQAAIDCPDPQLELLDSGPIDETVELVFELAFGQTVAFWFQHDIVAKTGYTADMSGGSLQGTAEITLHGELLPAYVTDLSHDPLPLATLEADSGFDYLTAPEPDRAGALPLLALALLRGRKGFKASR